MTLRGLLGAALTALSGSGGTVGELYFETVPGSEEIGNGIATALAQDARGLVWIGSPEGLARYDGYRFRQFRHDSDDPDSLPHNYIRDLLALPDGRLLVATQGGGLALFDPASETFRSHRHDPERGDSISSDALLVLSHDGDGGVWIGTVSGGLDHWSPGSTRFVHQALRPLDASGLDSETVRSLLRDRAGNLWVGTRNGLKRRAAGQSAFERIASAADDPRSLHGQYVYGLFESSDGRIWVGTQGHGALWLDPDTLQIHRLPPYPETNGVGHPWVGAFAEPRRGQLWLVTFGAGIDVYDLERERIVARLRHDPAVPGSLAMDRVMRPMVDRSGLIWIGTWGAGVQRHNPLNEAFTTLRHHPGRQDGLSDPVTLSVLDMEDGLLWVGTGGHGIDVVDPGQGVVARHRPDGEAEGALRDGTVRALARSADGQIWVGTHQAGLHLYLGNGRFLHLPEMLPDDRIRRLLASRDGSLLVGTQSGLAIVDTGTKRAQPTHFGDGMPVQSPVWSLAEDNAGNLWVGTPTDLLLRRSGEQGFERLRADATRASSMPSAAADLLVDSRGTLWSLGSGGLMRQAGWDGPQPRFERFQPRSGPAPKDWGSSLVEDRQGRLWTPLLVIDPVQGSVHRYGRADGVDIGNFELGAAHAGSDGQLAFAGTRGLLLIDPTRYRPWDFAAPVVATALEIDGLTRPLPGSDGLRLSPAERRFSVEFAALDYSDPAALRYAYRLEGLDPDWIPATAAFRVASYNNLWPGDYLLRVRGSHRGGDFSPLELALPVHVAADWWQTRSFLALSALLLLLLVLGGIRWRTRRILQRAHELALQVEQRTAELTASKERAERALDDLKAAQKQLVDSEKMASLGQLVAGVAHEINTPIGIAVTAASHLKDQIRHNEARLDAGTLSGEDVRRWRETTQEAMRLVLGSLERASTLIRSFKQVAVDQSSQQRRRFDLRTFLDEVRFALQPSYRRSAHSLDIDCPPGLEIDSYPGALFQVITNLVGNSLAHAFPAGRRGRMHIEAVDAGDALRLCYSDDGIGMSENVAARAFDPFFTTRRGSGGSGLGLHLVHNLVSQVLGGQLHLETVPGKGMRLLLTLPRQAPGPGTAP